jgi:hypothetical protein
MILPRIGLSRRRRLPTLCLLGGTFYPHEYIKFLPKTFGWKLVGEENDVYTLRHKNQIIKLRGGYSYLTLGEWAIWEKNYLPDFSLRGRTVLDVGAGCGETVHFYLSHGAASVIAVESDHSSLNLLYENAESNRWSVKVVPSCFRLGFMNFAFDFMKMDCEGCERELLKLASDRLPFCVIEVHDEETRRQLEKKFGLRLAWKLTDTVSILKK